MFRPSRRAWVSTLTTSPTTLEHLVEDLRAELRVGHLAAPELQRDLDLVALVDELVDLADLDVEVAPADLGRNLTSLTETFDDLRRDSLAFWASSYRNLP